MVQIEMLCSAKATRCRVCKKGDLLPLQTTRIFNPPTGAVSVPYLSSKCQRCGVETVLVHQHDKNLQNLVARRTSYGPYLLGEDILHLRRRYGLSQSAAAAIFGKSRRTFSRYEDEASFPDLSLTRLLSLALKHPLVLKDLAEMANVPIPLWEERQREAAVNGEL